MIRDFETIEEQVMEEKPDLILLDINLPSFDGFYWCRKLRQMTNTPIIFITIKVDDYFFTEKRLASLHSRR